MTAEEIETQRKILKSTVKMFIFVQETVGKSKSSLPQMQTFTPTHFIHIFECFKRLYKERQK